LIVETTETIHSTLPHRIVADLDVFQQLRQVPSASQRTNRS
jgi:hypothetical protein